MTTKSHKRAIHRRAVSRYKTYHYSLMKSVENGDGQHSLSKTTRSFRPPPRDRLTRGVVHNERKTGDHVVGRWFSLDSSRLRRTVQYKDIVIY